MPDKIIAHDFPFIGSDKLKKLLDIRKSQREQLRTKLCSPIYWWQFPAGRKIFWNWVLVRDFLLNGGDTPEHDLLVQEYLATLKPPQKNHPLKNSQAAV